MISLLPEGSGGKKRQRMPELAICPFDIVVDDREQLPYRFSNMLAGGSAGGSPILVKTVRKRILTGDISILSHESEITIERKSLDDLYTTLGQGRENFEHEHERMAAMVAAGGYACVVIESSFEEAILRPPPWTSLNPNSVAGTWHAWEMRYRVPWAWCGSRRTAELIAYAKLEMWWRQNVARRVGAA